MHSTNITLRRSLRSVGSCVGLVSTTLTASSAVAFPSAALTSVAVNAPIAVALDDTPAVDSIDRLRADYGALASWLRGKSRLGADERREVDTFRRRVTAFRAAHPDDAAAVALELQCATWLGDDAGVSAAFAELARLRPGDPAVALSRAKPLVAAHRYAEALAAIDQASSLPPALAVMRARVLIGLNRFADALAATNLVVGDDVTPNGALEAEQLRTQAMTCIPLWEAELAIRAEETTRDDLPRVELDTSRGTIVIELYEDHAPNTVANFVTLCTQDFYNGTRFHRVIPGFMAQGGDPNSRPGATGASGGGGPGYRIADEHRREDRRNHFSGSVAMAKTQAPDSAGSQFYICFAPPVHLNGQHTVFGHVIAGEEIAMSLQANDTINAARVLRKRDHEYRAETLPEITFTPPAPPVRTPPVTPPVR